MKLVADRFVVEDDAGAVDLATGRRVVIVTSPIATDVKEIAWSAVCDRFQRLHHPAIAPLVDYGPLEKGARFEAWQCGPRWSGADEEARRTRQRAGEFLGHAGLAIETSDVRVHARDVAPVIIPPTTGDLAPSSGDGSDLPLSNRGVVFIERPSVAALAEMFRELSGPRLHAAAIWGPPGAGKSRIVSELARLARLRGFVPICARFVDSASRQLWYGRSLFVIDDEDGNGWRAILQVAIESPLPHALLRVGTREVPGVDGVAVSRLAVEDLVAAIVPPTMSGTVVTHARRAAAESQGWPGRFVNALAGCRLATSRGRRHSGQLSRVAETPAAYGGDERVDALRTATTDVAVSESKAPEHSGAWPHPGSLGALRRRLAAGLMDLAKGRHARGLRLLRQAIGGFARRDQWTEATDAALALTRATLARGSVRDAQRVLTEARLYASRSGHDSALIDVATLCGEAWTDLARLDEAESVLAAAVTAGAAMQDSPQLALATIALARCLFWRGRYEEARSVIDRGLPEGSELIRIRRERWRARIACACGDGPSALSALVALADAVRDSVQASVRAGVLTTEAWVRLAIGDARGAAATARMAIADAHRGRNPLRAVRARLILAEAERRGERTSAAHALLRRLDRLRNVLPPIVGARLRLLTQLARDPRTDVATLVAQSGVPALALLAPPAGSTRVLEPLVDEVVAIARACQTADEELVVLKGICVRMRQRLHAASVAFVRAHPAGRSVLVNDGAGIDFEIADRAIEAAILIQPHRKTDRVEAAAPIQYAGVTIGALVVRWALGSSHDHSRAAAMLATAAVVAAPVVSAAIDRHARVVATGPAILGVTPEIQELRRQVDRAAAAPFPVLIVGESGSGKELVAQAIHRHSGRHHRAFRTLNCAAVPDDLADAELFGHVRGSFTGAFGDRAGIFEEAQGGTLLLDEVSELTGRVQAKLLRVLQEGEVRRVGENLSRRVDVRIIAATNRDLAVDAETGRFRADLLYRLDVIRIVTPSLRQRPDDIALLVDHYWREASTRVGSRARLSAATIGALARYLWPGNVRELQNILAALAVRCPRRGVILPSALPPQFGTTGASIEWRLDEARRTFEHRFVRAALVRNGGHRQRAAQELGVTRQGLTKLMGRLGIS